MIRSKRNWGAAAFALAFAAASLFSVLGLFPAKALVAPPSYAPRIFPSQQVAYVRFGFNYQSCVQSSNTCTMKVPAALPYNAAVLRVTTVTHTAFNSTTSDVVSVGTTAANANEIVSTGCSVHTQAVTSCTVAAGASSATGAGATQSGVNGGFDLFVKWTGGGGTPNAGVAAVVIEYVMPNDGICTDVPLNATAVGC